MSKNNQWFRNTSWNPEIETQFFNRLNRSRRYNKGQYLRIQATELLFSSDNSVHEKGIELMNVLISQYNNSISTILDAHTFLGIYYRRQKQYEKAIEQFDIVLKYNETNNFSYDMPDLRIAECIAEWGNVSLFDYAITLLNKMDRRTLILPELKERYDSAMRTLQSANIKH